MCKEKFLCTRDVKQVTSTCNQNIAKPQFKDSECIKVVFCLRNVETTDWKKIDKIQKSYWTLSKGLIHSFSPELVAKSLQRAPPSWKTSYTPSVLRSVSTTHHFSYVSFTYPTSLFFAFYNFFFLPFHTNFKKQITKLSYLVFFPTPPSYMTSSLSNLFPICV